MMKYRTIFTVAGCGRFPWDMLRYDRCFPETTEDAVELELDSLEDCTAIREITLVRFHSTKGDGEPTAARWRSFNWAVQPNSPRTIKMSTIRF